LLDGNWTVRPEDAARSLLGAGEDLGSDQRRGAGAIAQVPKALARREKMDRKE
jgi:hypothetical protein